MPPSLAVHFSCRWLSGQKLFLCVKIKSANFLVLPLRTTQIDIQTFSMIGTQADQDVLVPYMVILEPKLANFFGNGPDNKYLGLATYLQATYSLCCIIFLSFFPLFLFFFFCNPLKVQKIFLAGLGPSSILPNFSLFHLIFRGQCLLNMWCLRTSTELWVKTEQHRMMGVSLTLKCLKRLLPFWRSVTFST